MTNACCDCLYLIVNMSNLILRVTLRWTIFWGTNTPYMAYVSEKGDKHKPSRPPPTPHLFFFQACFMQTPLVHKKDISLAYSVYIERKLPALL